MVVMSNVRINRWRFMLVGFVFWCYEFIDNVVIYCEIGVIRCYKCFYFILLWFYIDMVFVVFNSLYVYEYICRFLI